MNDIPTPRHVVTRRDEEIVLSWPHFTPVSMTPLIEPAVIDYLNANLAILLPPILDVYLQDYVHIDGSRGMTGPLQLTAGSFANPALQFNVGNTDTGLLARGSLLQISVAGMEIAAFSQLGLQMLAPLNLSGNRVLNVADPTTATDVTTRQYVEDNYVSLAGSTLHGPLLLDRQPVLPEQVATKEYVDTIVAAQNLFQGLYYPATNTPPLDQAANATPRQVENGWSWTVSTADPLVPEATIVALPGIPLGTLLNNGDLVQWSSGPPAEFVIVRGSGLTQAAASALFVNLVGDVMTGGISFGSQNAASATDLSRHLALFGTTYGIGKTSTQMNYNVPIGGTHRFYAGGIEHLMIGADGATTPDQPQQPFSLTNRQYVDVADLLRVLKTGDTMTGPLTVTGQNLVSRINSTNTAARATLSWGAGANDHFHLFRNNGGTSLSLERISDAGAATGVFGIDRATGVTNWTGGNTYNAQSTHNAGINFGSTAVTSAIDLTRHIALWGGATPTAGGFGFSVTAGTLNYVVSATTNQHDFHCSTNHVARLNNTEFAMQGARDIRARDYYSTGTTRFRKAYTTGANYAAGERVIWDNVTFVVTTAITNAPATPPFTSLRLGDAPQGAFYSGQVTGTWAPGNWVHLASFPGFGHYRMSVDGFATAVDNSIILDITTAWNAGSIGITSYAKNPNGGSMWRAFRLSATIADGPYRLEGQINGGVAPIVKMHITGMNRDNNNNQTTVQKPPVAVANDLGGTQYQLLPVPPSGVTRTILGTTWTSNLTVNAGTDNSYYFPNNRGANNQFLRTDGNGNTTWAATTVADDPVVADLLARVQRLETRLRLAEARR